MSTMETALARIPGSLLRRAEELGLERGAMLRAAGLHEEELRDPDSRVPLSKWQALWRYLTSAVPDPDLGVRLGSAYRVRDAGLVGYTMQNSPTLRQALERLTRFVRILAEGPRVGLELRLEGGELSWRPDPGRLREMVDASLATVLAIARELTGAPIAPVRVRFPYGEPPRDLDRRREFFGARLEFEPPQAALSFRPADLELPVRGADLELGRYLEDYAQRILRSLVPGDTTAEKVERAIWAQMIEGQPTLASVAAALATSSRTLQRRLRQEGTSFAEILDSFRREMASDLLADRRLAVYEVSLLLGYSEPSTFHRAFRRWQGSSPRQYRAAAS